jgi:tetratricopeptide (TPR) repeat protein
MKIFNGEQIMTLFHTCDTVFKLPEQVNGFYFKIEIETDEISTGIGTDETEYLQHWELHNATVIDNKEYFLFKMWGKLPDHMVEYKDMSEHEGKEIAISTQIVFQVLNNLGAQAPEAFNIENLKKTQVIKNYLDIGEKKLHSKKETVNENLDREKSIDYCNKGIEAKRDAEYEKALEYYEKAINSDYSNPAPYMNSAKILIGFEEYNEAIRNILTYAHLKLPEIDVALFDEVSTFYKFEKSFKIGHNHRRIRKLFTKNSLLKQISVDINATFNAGLCYMMLNSDSLKITNKIPDDVVANERRILFGLQPNGLNLRQTHFANMMHIIGALFLYQNLKLNLENKNVISKFYLNIDNDLIDI